MFLFGEHEESPSIVLHHAFVVVVIVGKGTFGKCAMYIGVLLITFDCPHVRPAGHRTALKRWTSTWTLKTTT